MAEAGLPRTRAHLHVNSELLEESIYEVVTFGRAKHLIVMMLHYLLSLVSHRLPVVEEDDFAVAFSLEKDDVLRLAYYGTFDMPLRVPTDKSICFLNRDMLAIGDLAQHELTRNMDTRGMRSYVGSRVGALSVSIVTKHLIGDEADQFTYVFREAIKNFEEQLVDLNEAIVAERRQALLVRETELRELEAQTNRFVRHEVKNSIIGAMADLDAVRALVPSSQQQQQQTSHQQPQNRASAPSIPARPRHRSLTGIIGLPNFVAGGGFRRTRPTRTGATESMTSVTSSIIQGLDTVTRDLAKTMEHVLSASMVSEVLAGSYKPRNDVVDLGTLCSAVVVNTAGLVVNPANFIVETDSALVRHVLTNAISNAAKYGDATKPINVHFRLEKAVNSPVGTVFADVVNAAGPNHDALSSLANSDAIFELGTRYHARDKNVSMSGAANNTSLSAGDGAWIMRQCATALKGRCTIKFEAASTRFTFAFPASTAAPDSYAAGPAVQLGRQVGHDKQQYYLPKHLAALVALDDAPSQRRLLGRYFKGINARVARVYGAADDTVSTFVDNARALVHTSNPKLRFVFFLDDQLIFKQRDGSSVTASGIALGVELRNTLLADGQEHRSLFLVRTAEDTTECIERCRAVLHDHFPKASMTLATFRNELAKRWIERFGEIDESDDESSYDSDSDSDAAAPAPAPAAEFQSLENAAPPNSL